MKNSVRFYDIWKRVKEGHWVTPELKKVTAYEVELITEREAARRNRDAPFVIADLGCGDGRTLGHLMRDHGFDPSNMFGVDLSTNAVEYARNKLNGQAMILQADLTEPLIHEDAPYFWRNSNVVLISHTLEWVANQMDDSYGPYESTLILLESARKLLRSGGMLILTMKVRIIDKHFEKGRWSKFSEDGIIRILTDELGLKNVTYTSGSEYAGEGWNTFVGYKA